MTTTLTYGSATHGLLETAEVIPIQPARQATIPHSEIAQAIRAGLTNPLNYPPLSQATIPGDRVVLAIDRAIPQLLPVLDGVLLALRDAGVEAALTTILLADPEFNVEKLHADLVAAGHAEIRVTKHDAENEKEIAFLGVTQAGGGLRLNRELCDADVVLPITVARGELGPEAASPCFSGLYPEFSDRESIERFSAASEPTREPASESDECGRQLGVGMMLQIVPSADGQVATVIAGDPATVHMQAQAGYRAAWGCEATVRGELVIATITGNERQQTWQNLGRALVAAEAVLEEGGAIAVCSALAEPPGRAVGLLAGHEDLLVVEREILRAHGPDAAVALRLCHALQRGPVYLRSNLRSQVVESLGMTPLESDNELEHLAQTMRPCLVLEEAQHLLPTLVEAEQ